MSDDSRCFVDTNILINAYSDPSDLRQLAAKNLINALLSDDRICFSTQVLQELYVTLVKK